MMENRSFDHMLGYLSLEEGAPKVNGLRGPEVNFNRDRTGKPYGIFEWGADETGFYPPAMPLKKEFDPSHSPESIKAQIANEMGGFVQDFIDKRDPIEFYRGLPMGYYTGQHLPVYDFLARQYCVCDAWHSSIPGDTWLNRQFAVAGRWGPTIWRGLSWLDRLKGLFKELPLWKKLESVPLYDVPAFTRQLDESQWRWYSHDPATLRATDARYRDFDDLNRDNFAYFDRKRVSFVTEALELAIVGRDSFLDDAAKNELRDVSWIDPNFVDLDVFDPNSNDDHPPSDLRAGQALVYDVYDALTKTRDWDDTLLIITYDEHGGFYDHVVPPAATDGSGFPTLGVRVPALVVGPRVKNEVLSETMEHTSLIKTIFNSCLKDPEAAVAAMDSERLREAPDLGIALEETPRSDIDSHAHLHAVLDQWREEKRIKREALPDQPSAAPDGAGRPLVLHEFQEEFIRFALTVRGQGLPSGQP